MGEGGGFLPYQTLQDQCRAPSLMASSPNSEVLLLLDGCDRPVAPAR